LFEKGVEEKKKEHVVPTVLNPLGRERHRDRDWFSYVTFERHKFSGFSTCRVSKLLIFARPCYI
jgi:membrane-anchored protein YejM (alkaline phosphatase superfamily)